MKENSLNDKKITTNQFFTIQAQTQLMSVVKYKNVIQEMDDTIDCYTRRMDRLERFFFKHETSKIFNFIYKMRIKFCKKFRDFYIRVEDTYNYYYEQQQILFEQKSKLKEMFFDDVNSLQFHSKENIKDIEL